MGCYLPSHSPEWLGKERQPVRSNIISSDAQVNAVAHEVGRPTQTPPISKRRANGRLFVDILKSSSDVNFFFFLFKKQS